LGGLLGAIGYLAILFEILFHTNFHGLKTPFIIQIVALYHMLLIVAARYVIYKEKMDPMKLTVGILMASIIILYLPFGYFNAVSLRDLHLNQQYSIFPFLFHYLNVGLCAWMSYLLLVDAVESDGYLSSKYEYAVLLACVLFVFFTTVEYEHLFVLFVANTGEDIAHTVNDFRLTSFTVLWTILSFVLMYLGMKWKIKEVRKISLFLFGLTIVKFFLKDFWNMDAVGKIISFLVIGALLIIVSQMYKQQLRTLIESGELTLDRDEQISEEKAEALAKLRQELEAAKALEEEGEESEETEDSGESNEIDDQDEEEKKS